MAMKPLPRLILIIAAVAGIGWGLYFAKDLIARGQPAAATSEAAQPLTATLPAQTAAPLSPAQPAPPLVVMPATAQIASEPAPEASTSNAGMAKLLSAGAKK